MKKSFKDKKFLVYIGTPGIGKTYLCAAMMEWIVESFNSYRYWKIDDLHARLRESFDHPNGDYNKLLETLIDDELIQIDDIGSDKISEWKEEILFSIVDQRYNCMFPTVITSNLSRDQFERTYHERITSRLFDKENTIIEVLDPSKNKRL